jgi:type VI secretion system (T6SS) baseplate-like injector VgrG
MDDERKPVRRVTLEVGADVWERVSTLESSAPRDRHYTAHEDEQGRWVVTFGDGVHGARPPAGAQIVTATYESGGGRYDRVILQVGRVASDADSPPDGSAQRACCGIYRGRVADAADPLATGRLRVQIPEILGSESVWARPCTPVGQTAIPAAGQSVWILFEHGDSERPVWIGTLPV